MIQTASTFDSSSDTEYLILENIYDSGAQQEPIRQRDLAQIAGASLGMTNSILKRLAQKGWITVKKLNSRNIQYAITPNGINEIIHRSYRYFKRTIRNVVYFKDIIENLVLEAGQRNINTVLLVGASDLDFIVEHTARHYGLSFARTIENRKANDYSNMFQSQQTLEIYAESITEMNEDQSAASRENTFFLSQLIIKHAAETGRNENR